MNILEQRLQGVNKVLLIAGGLSTELERLGYTIDGGVLWSSRLLYEAPEAIYQVHRDYLNAGADIITTCSYQGSIEGFMKSGFSRTESEEYLRSSVSLARKAVVDHYQSQCEDQSQGITQSDTSIPLVALSLGCYGATLANGAEYHGNYAKTTDQLREFHENRLKCLLSTKPDLLLFETIPCRQEAQAICDLLRTTPFHIPTMLSFSCRNGKEVCHGELFAHDCVPLINNVNDIVAVGVNCTSPSFVEELILSAKSMTDRYLLCYPNSGENWTKINRWTIDEDVHEVHKDWGEWALRWRQMGARIIGGCCRTRPSDIRTMHSSLVNSRWESSDLDQ